MKKINILYFYQYFGTPKGGWSTRVYELTKRWVIEGHKITVVTSPYDKSDIKAKKLIEHLTFEGIKVIVLNFPQSNKHSFFYRIFTFSLFSIVSIYFALTLNYNCVISSSGPITIGIPGLVGKYIRRKKLVFEVRDLWPQGAIELQLLNNKRVQKLAYWFEGLCYKSSDLIVPCSNGMAQSIKVRFPSSIITTIPNASDNQLFGGRDNHFLLPEWTQDKNIFIYTGSIGLMDNCEQLVEAAEELNNRKDKKNIIVILGEGAEKKELESKVRNKGLTNIFFLGLLPKMEVVSWLKKATAAFLVFKNIPVLNTSSPNKLFDAFAAGVPIIQTTQGWIKELVEEEECGLNVLPNDPSNMADAIQLVAENSELRNNLALNAKRVALEKFDRDKLANKMIKAIEEVVKKK